MALPLPSNTNLLTYNLRFKPQSSLPHQFKPPISSLKLTKITSKRRVFRINAVEESADSETAETESEENRTEEIGAEIKKAMMERKKEEKEGGELLSGVGEEIGEIEWPVFGKVLATTGVVLAVIAGSSVVLLTVNAVLAELSDRVFAGRGVQDFF